MNRSASVTQRPIPPAADLRDMLRQHLIRRSLECMAQAGTRRQQALRDGRIAAYQDTVRRAVRSLYGELPVGANAPGVCAKQVSAFEKNGYRLENVLFESFPGWEVNATVYVPLDHEPPFPAVVVPVGHSGKQFESYQFPCQFFARAGFLAIVFDPPGQASEKQPGNDHFIDGVRCYVVGETSSRYFVADALRCIDYLESRSDVDMSGGVAMTGVSGGGTTTTFAALLDDRIRVIGPSCCLTRLADLDITQCYAGCPETHMWRRYAEGIDEVDLLCAAAPTPTLLMAGKHDEVFRIEDTRELAAEATEFHKATGAGERFQFFVDSGGHAYSLAQAREFVRFMNRWLLNRPDRPIPDLPDEPFSLDPEEQLKCRPRTDVNMRSLTLDRARELADTRDRDAQRIRRAAAELAGVSGVTPAPKATVGEPFRAWTHTWRQALLEPEAGIELPATFLTAEETSTPTILHFDDRHRHRLLERHGLLAKASRFLDRSRPGLNLLTIDLCGWGDTTPALYPYEMAGWGGVDRYLAYTSAALGDSIMGMRIRDGLAALAFLRTRSEVDTEKIMITGCGLGGIVALHVAAIDGGVKAVLVWDTLLSFQSLLEVQSYTWPADTFIPNILLHYDLPELIGSLACEVSVLNPLDGSGESLPAEFLESLDHQPGPRVFVPGNDVGGLLSRIESALAEESVR